MGFRRDSSRRWCFQLTNVAVLGSTGSIGSQSIEVIRHLPGYRVFALSARDNWRAALLQSAETGAEYLALEDPLAAAQARKEKDALGLVSLQVLEGPHGAVSVATMPEVDVVVHAIPGFAGIEPLLGSLGAGKRVAFAGKEALVSAGELIRPYLSDSKGQLVPVDSEHSAVFQCLQGEDPRSVEEVVLTASGGALRDLSLEEMGAVTPEDVLRHPTWKMGKKVTVDSATLFNKALEVVEAHYLFDIPYSKIRVVVHRQSVVHSMVTFVDGSTKAQAARPDMRLAIAYGITYPTRPAGAHPSLAPYVGSLTFEEPDHDRFPCLRLGYLAGQMGGTAPCVLSAADEVLVEEFLNGRIRFLDIQRTLRKLLEDYVPKEVTGLEVLFQEKCWAEKKVRELLS